ncbi:MAG TPA: hypothetical protein VE081_10865 [Sporichthyaceae bacterium]|nr:hypothetical protein [Sporichthyaceae bacterium]
MNATPAPVPDPASGTDRAHNPWVREHFGFPDLDRTPAAPTRHVAPPARAGGRHRGLAALAVAVLGVGVVVGVGGHAIAASVGDGRPGAGPVFVGDPGHGPDGHRGRGH